MFLRKKDTKYACSQNGYNLSHEILSNSPSHSSQFSSGSSISFCVRTCHIVSFSLLSTLKKREILNKLWFKLYLKINRRVQIISGIGESKYQRTTKAKGREKIYGVPWPGFGEISRWKKVSAPFFIMKKKYWPVIFLRKKSLGPPFFFKKKVLARHIFSRKKLLPYHFF